MIPLYQILNFKHLIHKVFFKQNYLYIRKLLSILTEPFVNKKIPFTNRMGLLFKTINEFKILFYIH